MHRSIITGSGCYIPSHVISNQQFSGKRFFSNEHKPLPEPENIVRKFELITGIRERRYVSNDLQAAEIGYLAARQAIEKSGTSQEEIDQIIVAHNFGNLQPGSTQGVMVPALASIIKHRLGIKNPSCIAYDIIFGCPGWLQGIIQADAFFKAGMAQKAIIIGTETLSRVIDDADRDSMIFSDGAGAVVLEYLPSGEADSGFLGSLSRSDTREEFNYINMSLSYSPDADQSKQFIKMNGRKVYEYAVSKVPDAIRSCLDKCKIGIAEVKKIFIHQANEKMDDSIVGRLYNLYGMPSPPAHIMPMSIQWLGNSSVATLPTLYDLVLRGQLPDHHLNKGDLIVFASVGAGMNINAACYRV